MENLDNKWVLNASTNDDCKEKDGNNPVTLGLENMRGVSPNTMDNSIYFTDLNLTNPNLDFFLLSSELGKFWQLS